jgi:hypothetical protein
MSNQERKYNKNYDLLKTIIKELNIDLSILFHERMTNSIHNDDINLMSLNHSAYTSFKNENHQVDYELLLLSKLLEYYAIEKYKKNLGDISETINRTNLSDFIMQNLFLNEDIFDLMNQSYKNLKQKFFWNFSEIIFFIYSKHPRILKYTIYRHLKYSPSQECLLNQLIQYYYDNRDYKKSKNLIRVK